MLPAIVYRQEGDGRVEAPTHPVARLVRSPNVHQTWPDWIEWCMGSVLLFGNALAIVRYDARGRPTELQPVLWPCANVSVLADGRIAYDVNRLHGPAERFFEGEVFHLKDRSDEGLIGRARLSRAPDVLQAALGLQRFSSHIWDHQAGGSPVPRRRRASCSWLRNSYRTA
jgi:phage portal protein BeeE